MFVPDFKASVSFLKGFIPVIEAFVSLLEGFVSFLEGFIPVIEAFISVFKGHGATFGEFLRKKTAYFMEALSAPFGKELVFYPTGFHKFLIFNSSIRAGSLKP